MLTTTPPKRSTESQPEQRENTLPQNRKERVVCEMLQTTRSFWDEETKRQRDKKTKSQRDGGGSSLGWQVHTCHTGAQRDEESKRQRDKESKRRRDKKTKSQRVKERKRLRVKETVPQDLADLISDSLERNVRPWSKEHERKENVGFRTRPFVSLYT